MYYIYDRTRRTLKYAAVASCFRRRRYRSKTNMHSRNYIAVGVLYIYIYLKLRYMLNNISVEQHQITAEQLRIFSQILFKNDKN